MLQTLLPLEGHQSLLANTRLHRLPHPIPYQGSKRRLAARITSTVNGRRFRRLLEPFAGSAAITIASAQQGLATTYEIGDSLPTLVDIWNQILYNPEDLVAQYEAIWYKQVDNPAAQFVHVRDQFNCQGGAAELLYLLARCVKNAPRFNARGEFNQSADHRRRGAHPTKMRAQILGVANLLRGRASARCEDFEAAVARAEPGDLVYLDPPWGGTTYGNDKRYHQGVERDRLVRALLELDRRRVAYLLSYDGTCGERTYGAALPEEIGARRVQLVAGRSSQATLVGRNEVTVESLYVSRWAES